MVPVIHRPALPVPLPLLRGGLAATTAAGGRTTLGLGTAAVEDYEEGTFTATGVGFSGTAPSGTAVYTRIGRFVVLVFPTLQGTSNATTLTVTGLPAGIQPSVGIETFVRILDNSVTVAMGLTFIGPGSAITVYATLAGNAFTASGTKALLGAICPYYI